MVKARGSPGKISYKLLTSKSLNLANMKMWVCKCYLSREHDTLNQRAEMDVFTS